MVVQCPDLLGEEFGPIPASTPGTIIFADQEYLVHAQVDGVRAASRRELINEVKSNLVHVRVQRTITAAVNTPVVGILTWRLIELGVRS